MLPLPQVCEGALVHSEIWRLFQWSCHSLGVPIIKGIFLVGTGFLYCIVTGSSGLRVLSAIFH